MSWISENYEKTALAGAAVIAIGLSYFGWQNLSAVEEDFSSRPRGGGNEVATIKDSDRVTTAKSSFEIDRSWIQGETEGRPVDLFIGVPLFVNKNNLNQPVDLPRSADVHPPIPNQWWIEHRIDPGFGDSPQRDEDEDGFSNLEEFNAKTDPTDKRSYPSLIHKLKYVTEESLQWVLRPGYASEDGGFTFVYDDGNGNQIKTGAANPVPKDGLFFSQDPAKGRFKYLGFEKIEQMNERIQSKVAVTMVKVEDMKPNKKGLVYEIPAQFKKANAREFSKFDRTAVFSLEALGLDGQEFKVEEFTAFALPQDADSKRYKLVKVTPESVEIQETLEDGTTQSYEIIKGQTGATAK